MKALPSLHSPAVGDVYRGVYNRDCYATVVRIEGAKVFCAIEWRNERRGVYDKADTETDIEARDSSFSLAWTLFSRANTTEDIGAVDMSRAAATEGEWMESSGHWQHSSGALVGQTRAGRWYWFAPGKHICPEGSYVSTREEAERLALGLTPGLTPDGRRFTAEPTPALIPATEQARRVANPWTATGRDLDALLDSEGTSRLPGDDDEAARAQLLRSMWPRGPMQVVEMLEAGILEARRAQQYGKRVEAKGTQVRKFASVGLARVVAWAVSGERLAGAEGGGR